MNSDMTIYTRLRTIESSADHFSEGLFWKTFLRKTILLRAGAISRRIFRRTYSRSADKPFRIPLLPAISLLPILLTNKGPQKGPFYITIRLTWIFRIIYDGFCHPVCIAGGFFMSKTDTSFIIPAFYISFVPNFRNFGYALRFSHGQACNAAPGVRAPDRRIRRKWASIESS